VILPPDIGDVDRAGGMVGPKPFRVSAMICEIAKVRNHL
jgi:hypothetical protein